MVMGLNFFLSRSIRQGYLFALTLFIVVVDARFHLFRDDSLFLRIKGITLANGGDLSNMQFADDTTTLLELEEHNLDSLFLKLELFCEAFGSRIFVSKSIMLGWETHPPI